MIRGLSLFASFKHRNLSTGVVSNGLPGPARVVTPETRSFFAATSLPDTQREQKLHRICLRWSEWDSWVVARFAFWKKFQYSITSMSRHIVVPDRETEKKKIIERAKGNSKTVWQAGSRLLLSSEMGRAMLSKACNVSYATLFIACSAWSGPPKIGSILLKPTSHK
jgi:hypothetical protein